MICTYIVMLRLVIIEGDGGQGHEGAGVFDGLLEEEGSEVVDDFVWLSCAFAFAACQKEADWARQRS